MNMRKGNNILNEVVKFILPLILFVCAVSDGWAQRFMNRCFSPDIKTLQIYLNNNQLDFPVLRLDAEDYVTVSFDWMSHDFRHLAYRIKYCNADWTLSELTEMEYMEGLNEMVIEDPVMSMNTTFDYSHYEFTLPNEEMKMTLPGNYAVQVFDTDDPSATLLTACFSIQDPKVTLAGSVDGKSVYGVNKEYQHLTFELFNKNGFAAFPEELKVVVRQNGRHDNEVFDIKPTYVKPESLVFDDEHKLTFEGGREFNVADFSHRYRYSGRIDRITYHRPYYHVEMLPGKWEHGRNVMYEHDVDGGYIVNQQDVWSNAEIDYSVVHFTYPKDEPWLDGALYVSGRFCDGRLSDWNKMTYNYERHQYELDIVLKNGGYNFQYLFVPAGSKVGLPSRAEGSIWETGNEYQIYVYYRPLGSNYDRLVGYERIKTNY